MSREAGYCAKKEHDAGDPGNLKLLATKPEHAKLRGNVEE
jgi:hypothetical protein